MKDCNFFDCLFGEQDIQHNLDMAIICFIMVLVCLYAVWIYRYFTKLNSLNDTLLVYLIAITNYPFLILGWALLGFFNSIKENDIYR